MTEKDEQRRGTPRIRQPIKATVKIISLNESIGMLKCINLSTVYVGKKESAHYQVRTRVTISHGSNQDTLQSKSGTINK